MSWTPSCDCWSHRSSGRVRLSTAPPGTREPSLSSPPPAWPAPDLFPLQSGPFSWALAVPAARPVAQVGVTFLTAPRGTCPQLLSLAPERAQASPCFWSITCPSLERPFTPSTLGMPTTCQALHPGLSGTSALLSGNIFWFPNDLSACLSVSPSLLLSVPLTPGTRDPPQIFVGQVNEDTWGRLPEE